MGCDIHAFIEVKPSDGGRWECISDPYLGRNYEMFGFMASVRSDKTLFKPKGLPEDCSWRVNFENEIFVYNNGMNIPTEHHTTPQNAEHWVKSGLSKWVNDSKTKITHPDWHSHSWLTIDEFAKCIRGMEYNTYYKIALATMRAAKKLGFEVRLVFWFDN